MDSKSRKRYEQPRNQYSRLNQGQSARDQDPYSLSFRSRKNDQFPSPIDRNIGKRGRKESDHGNSSYAESDDDGFLRPMKGTKRGSDSGPSQFDFGFDDLSYSKDVHQPTAYSPPPDNESGYSFLMTTSNDDSVPFISPSADSRKKKLNDRIHQIPKSGQYSDSPVSFSQFFSSKNHEINFDIDGGQPSVEARKGQSSTSKPSALDSSPDHSSIGNLFSPVASAVNSITNYSPPLDNEKGARNAEKYFWSENEIETILGDTTSKRPTTTDDYRYRSQDSLENIANISSPFLNDLLDTSSKTLDPFTTESPSNSNNGQQESEEYNGDDRKEDAENSIDKSPGDVIMCLFQCGDRFGGAVYYVFSQQMKVLHDISETLSDLRAVRDFIQQINPSSIIISRGCDIRFLNAVSSHTVGGTSISGSGDKQTTSASDDPVGTEGEEDESDLPVLIQLPNKNFNYDNGKLRLERLIGDGRESEYVKDIAMKFCFSMESRSMIRASGCLLKYLDMKRVGVELEDFGKKTPIVSVKSIAIDKVMEIDANTFRALDIFIREDHPSIFKAGKSGFREGTSIFSLFNRCRSNPGRRELRRWFQRPLCNLKAIQERQAAVGFFASEANREFASSLQKQIRTLKHVHRMMNRLDEGEMKVSDWMALIKSINAILKIKNELGSRRCNVDLIQRFLQDVSDGKLNQIAVMMGKLISIEEMKQRNRFVVKKGINAKLDKLKELYRSLPDLLHKVAKDEMVKFRDYIKSCTCVYIPLLGYILTVESSSFNDQSLVEKYRSISETASYSNRIVAWKALASSGKRGQESKSMESRQRFDRTTDLTTDLTSDLLSISAVEDSLIPGLEFVFVSNSAINYKTSRMKELDDKLGDIKFKINDLEKNIALELMKKVKQVMPAVINGVRVAAQIDCLIAMGLTGRESGWIRPILTEQNVIRIDQARHPLMDHINGSSVPNSFASCQFVDRILVITGPNASGKTVYMKTVGVLVYLACVGSLIPAREAVIGMVDRIFTRIHSIDTVLNGMSTFAEDLQQVSKALRSGSNQSLVIMDEFGKGTMSEVGLGLLVSTVEYWLSKETLSPHVLVSTHFHQIVNYLPKTPFLTLKTMEVMQDQDGDLVFVYRIVDGVIRYSFANYTAQMAGIRLPIIQRSLEVYSAMMNDKTSVQGRNELDVINVSLAKAVKILRNTDSDRPLNLPMVMDRFKTAEEHMKKDHSSISFGQPESLKKPTPLASPHDESQNRRKQENEENATIDLQYSPRPFAFNQSERAWDKTPAAATSNKNQEPAQTV